MREVVTAPVRELQYTEIVPDEPMPKEAEESSVKKAGRIAGKIIRTRFFLPVILYMSASALFFSSIRYFGLKKAVRGVKAGETVDPVKTEKRVFKRRQHKYQRRLLLLQILASKKTKKSAGYQKLLKIIKLYKPVKEV